MHQVDALGTDLSLSKERENQLSKKLAASWKEVSNIGRECEALRVGGESQEIAMVEAQKLLQDTVTLMRVSTQKESLLEQQLAEAQASAFEVSSQVSLSDMMIDRVSMHTLTCTLEFRNSRTCAHSLVCAVSSMDDCC
jgi:hypothetical protein